MTISPDSGARWLGSAMPRTVCASVSSSAQWECKTTYFVWLHSMNSPFVAIVSMTIVLLSEDFGEEEEVVIHSALG